MVTQHELKYMNNSTENRIQDYMKFRLNIYIHKSGKYLYLIKKRNKRILINTKTTGKLSKIL